MQILIVDDSKSMRMILKRQLRGVVGDSHEVAEASNGVEALAAVEASQVDLVLSDWNMDQMTGIELLQSLRRDGRTVPLGFITSESSAEVRQQAADAGALFLVVKPFTPHDLAAALKPIMSGDGAVPAHMVSDVASPAATWQLPSAADVSNLLSELLGRKAKVTAAPGAPTGNVVVALYAGGDQSAHAACVFDLGSASSAGAALSMIPKGVAAQSVQDGRLADGIADNVREIFNVVGSLFSAAGAPRLVLRDVHLTGPAPAALTELQGKAKALNVSVDIDGYDGGLVSLLVA
jgi:two-component system chemotaxis response regulator CheY